MNNETSQRLSFRRLMPRKDATVFSLLAMVDQLSMAFGRLLNCGLTESDLYDVLIETK